MEITYKAYQNFKRKLRAQRRRELSLPQYSVAEEVFSAVSHGVGALLAVAGFVTLLFACRREPLAVACASVFGVCMVLMYTVSTLYHALGVCKGKYVFRILDHCDLFLMIAGTYTPVALAGLGGVPGWVMFGIVWGVSAVGIALNAVSVLRFRTFTMACSIVLGWMVVFFLRPLGNVLAGGSVFLLILGGIFYTVGAVLYRTLDKVKFMHGISHLFILAGSVCHYFVIYRLLT